MSNSNLRPIILTIHSHFVTGKTRTKDKYRVVYNDHQRMELEKEFTFNNRYITIRRKSELSASLGLSERQIKIWFQNRRAKERKLNKKKAEENAQMEPSTTTAGIGPYPQHPLHQQGLSAMPMSSHILGHPVPKDFIKIEEEWPKVGL